MGEIVEALEIKFEVPRHLLSTDVEQAINHLHTTGAIELEIVAR